VECPQCSALAKRLARAERQLVKIKKAAFRVGFMKLGGVLTAPRDKIARYLKKWPAG
jgi:hypothetical protein